MHFSRTSYMCLAVRAGNILPLGRKHPPPPHPASQSFFSWEVTSYTDTSYCIHILWEVFYQDRWTLHAVQCINTIRNTLAILKISQDLLKQGGVRPPGLKSWQNRFTLSLQYHFYTHLSKYTYKHLKFLSVLPRSHLHRTKAVPLTKATYKAIFAEWIWIPAAPPPPPYTHTRIHNSAACVFPFSRGRGYFRAVVSGRFPKKAGERCYFQLPMVTIPDIIGLYLLPEIGGFRWRAMRIGTHDSMGGGIGSGYPVKVTESTWQFRDVHECGNLKRKRIDNRNSHVDPVNTMR